MMLQDNKFDTRNTIDSEGFKGGTRGAPIMPRDAVSRTAHVGTVGKNGLNPTHNNIYLCIK